MVLIVIGLAAALVYARFDSDPRQTLEREGRRLGAALEHAALLAQWQNETLGVSAVGGAYRFWRRGPGSDDWSAVSDDDVLAAARAAEHRRGRRRTYAGQPVPPDAIVPLRASGRNEPFVIEIAAARMARPARCRPDQSRRRCPRHRFADAPRRIYAGRGPGRAGDPRGRARGGVSQRRAKRGQRHRAEGAHARAVGRAEPAGRGAARTAGAGGRRAQRHRGAGRRRVRWRETVSGTPNPAFRKIEITVADPSTPDYVLARLVGLPRPVGTAMMHRVTRARGFTLLEVLIAIAIVAVIALLGYRALAALSDSETRLAAEATRWRTLDLFFCAARRRHAPGGAARRTLGSTREAPWLGFVADARATAIAALAFSRAGPEFNFEPGSAGQRLGYRLRDGTSKCSTGRATTVRRTRKPRSTRCSATSRISG